MTRLRRTLRVWRLSARNGARFAVHRVHRRLRPHHRRQQLDDAFAIRTSEDVARELGQMKGALMKFGQLVSFIVEALPAQAQQALAGLQADAPPMSADAAAEVVRGELGDVPERVFLDWSPTPVAAASIGQVHRAVTRDGELVAVKVQYPDVDAAIEADLDNAEGLYRLMGAFVAKGLDAKGLVDELRNRMRDELDYRLEADNQRAFADHFAGHPFVHVPHVVDATQRVLVSEWVDGITFDRFLATADRPDLERAGESIWRFAQHAIHRLGVFNGDPHPGNYRFHRHHDRHDVWFLDFGLVKRWAPGEWERLRPSVDAIVVDRDPEQLVVAMEDVGFLAPGHGLAPDDVYAYVSAPYVPYLDEEFTFDRAFVQDTLTRIIDVNGPYSHVIAKLNLPPSFVVLDRVVWGVSAILGKIGMRRPWRAMLLEYLADAPPATPLGEAEHDWRQRTGR